MIAVVDVCSGNLRSVEKALAHVGGDVVLTSDPDTIRRADQVVVPGQGAFGEFARGLAGRGLEAALREALASGKPFLGICLGLQVLFDDSEEQGPVTGLGLVPGHVVKFRRPAELPADAPFKIPHMGWNQVRHAGAGTEPLLSGIPDGSYVYFVHSYHVVPADPGVTVLECDYGGRFCAAIRRDNLFACQFHPEKSQRVGLRLLENFVRS
ncbi:MAG: imidazole glycerol phosphate synthase subunit HisH [Kofleriaceae bacterium]|nr:imidazole glycerol phosphate synthase subunit HisH [Kofleriaceae bacterium]MCB9574977.1 imidazole glycerol phosphate synthase subunit HisH [Kofleriaceae bacterium]